MSRSVLVTGAGGFIGRFACRMLSQKSWKVHAVSKKQLDELGDNIITHTCDLLDPNQVKDLFTEVKPSHVLHFAWYAEPGKYWRSLDNFSWVEASLVLLRKFQEAGGERVVMAGTCAEYDWRYGFCSEDVTPAVPDTPYGICKNSLRQMLQSFSRETGLSSAWGRIFFLYGPNEAKGRLVPSVITSLLKDEVAKCTHGNQIRDFLHVEDVASAFVALLESDVQGPVNIASGQPIALKTIIYTIADYLGKRDLIQLGTLPASENEPPLLVADVRKLNRQLGWLPGISIEEGIKNTIRWWKQNL